MAAHNTIGKRGEEQARRFLEKKGYQIVAQNYKTKRGEVDIIARRKGVLVFAEVRAKYHERFGSPEDTLHYKKRKKMLLNAQAYTAWNGYAGRYRIDALCVVLAGNGIPKRVDHYENIVENPI